MTTEKLPLPHLSAHLRSPTPWVGPPFQSPAPWVDLPSSGRLHRGCPTPQHVHPRSSGHAPRLRLASSPQKCSPSIQQPPFLARRKVNTLACNLFKGVPGLPRGSQPLLLYLCLQPQHVDVPKGIGVSMMLHASAVFGSLVWNLLKAGIECSLCLIQLDCLVICH
jgi:hypothetical protein